MSRHTRWAFSSAPRIGLAAWLASAHSVLLDAVSDPGVVGSCSSLTQLPLLPASSTRSSAHPNLEPNGANYQIQRLTLHLAASVQLHASPATLAAEFPLLALSIASRVPGCRLVTVTHFDEHRGWLTIPFLRGFPPPCSEAISRFTVDASDPAYKGIGFRNLGIPPTEVRWIVQIQAVYLEGP